MLTTQRSTSSFFNFPILSKSNNLIEIRQVFDDYFKQMKFKSEFEKLIKTMRMSWNNFNDKVKRNVWASINGERERSIGTQSVELMISFCVWSFFQVSDISTLNNNSDSCSSMKLSYLTKWTKRKSAERQIKTSNL